MTYGPKIEPVKKLECRRTTRIYNEDNPFEVGDFALIHGWAGKPYRTPWNWRLPKMSIVKVIDMLAFEHVAGFWQHPITGIPFSTQSVAMEYYPWQHPIMEELARLDGIEPATGIEYLDVLEKFHGRFTEKPTQFQVIEW
jgi:hypothetical protein